MPGPPTVTLETDHQQVRLVFAADPTVDRWEIARRPGIVADQSGDPLPEDVVAHVPASSIDWVDRYANRVFSTYNIRGRTSALLDTWTAWSTPADNSAGAGAALRTKLESPNAVLELDIQPNPSGFGSVGGAVETSLPYRYVVQGGDILELEFIWRAQADLADTTAFSFGFRWYDRAGQYVGSAFDTIPLTPVHNEPPSRTTVFRAVAPNNAAKASIFFELPETIVPHERGVTTFYDLYYDYTDFDDVYTTFPTFADIYPGAP